VETTAPQTDYSSGDCTEYQWRDPDYNECKATSPGYVSTTDAGPTEARVEGIYSQLAGDADLTANGPKTCPDGTSIIMKGAVNEHQACRLWDVGKCTDQDGADYCQAGGDFSCPLGFQLAGARDTLDHEGIEDCVMCEGGNSCATSTSASCEAGYHCPSYTEDAKAFATPPGTYREAASSDSIGGAAVCGASGSGYCPPASATPQTCSAGYTATL